MFRSKRSNKRRKSPYPQRGTPEGDVRQGECAACGEDIYRGDFFVCNLAGDLLHIGQCIPEYVNKMRESRQVEADMSTPDTYQYDGEFPI